MAVGPGHAEAVVGPGGGARTNTSEFAFVQAVGVAQLHLGQHGAAGGGHGLHKGGAGQEGAQPPAAGRIRVQTQHGEGVAVFGTADRLDVARVNHRGVLGGAQRAERHRQVSVGQCPFGAREAGQAGSWTVRL